MELGHRPGGRAVDVPASIRPRPRRSWNVRRGRAEQGVRLASIRPRPRRSWNVRLSACNPASHGGFNSATTSQVVEHATMIDCRVGAAQLQFGHDLAGRGTARRSSRPPRRPTGFNSATTSQVVEQQREALLDRWRAELASIRPRPRRSWNITGRAASWTTATRFNSATTSQVVERCSWRW